MVETTNENRENQIASCFSQGINPHGHVDDYAEVDGDHNANENAVFEEMNDLDDNSKDYAIYRNVNAEE